MRGIYLLFHALDFSFDNFIAECRQVLLIEKCFALNNFKSFSTYVDLLKMFKITPQLKCLHLI